MFPGNDPNFGGLPSGPFGGDGRGEPPAGDAIFGSAFEELDGSSLDEEFLAASEAIMEKQHAFLNVGLHFFEKLNALKRS